MKEVRAAGLDFLSAPIETRALFAFTSEAALDFLTGMKMRGCDCVLLSTCNRTVLWTCGERDPAEILRAARGDADFFRYSGDEAVRHLYEVAAGLRSQVPLEQQILGQLKNALNRAMLIGSCGAYLNKLFLGAISAGKEVRAKLNKGGNNSSAAQIAVEKCLCETGSLQGQNALVIGSGEIGMLCARMLMERGASVMMTRRKPRNDGVPVPDGIKLIPYEDRYQALRSCRAAISATACPRAVLRAEYFLPPRDSLVIFDLAVPRDVEPSIGALEGVRLFDIDSLGYAEVEAATRLGAEKILRRHIRRFDEWARLRGCKPLFDELYTYFERELSAEFGCFADADKIKSVSRRATDKLLFALKDKTGLDKAVELYTILAEAARK